MFRLIVPAAILVIVVSAKIYYWKPPQVINVGGSELQIRNIAGPNAKRADVKNVLECLFADRNIKPNFIGVGRNQLEDLAASGILDAVYPIVTPSSENLDGMAWVGPITSMKFSWFMAKEANLGSDTPGMNSMIAATAGGAGPRWLNDSGYMNILELRTSRALFEALLDRKADYVLTLNSQYSAFQLSDNDRARITELPAFQNDTGLGLTPKLMEKFPQLKDQLSSQLSACKSKFLNLD